MMAKCVKRMITERCGCAVDYRWMNVRMRERGSYCSKAKRVKKLESQQRRERVRHRRRESFLQPATRDITVFLLRGFSLVRKKGFVCLSVCVSVCAKLSRNMLTPPGMPSALLSSSALLHDFCLFLLMTFFFVVSLNFPFPSSPSSSAFYLLLLPFHVVFQCALLLLRSVGSCLFIVPMPLGLYPFPLNPSIFDRL